VFIIQSRRQTKGFTFSGHFYARQHVVRSAY